jgi:hypothetical protein
MNVKRVGMVLFGVGLFVAGVAAVVGVDAGCAAATCPGTEFAFERIGAKTLLYRTRCAVCAVGRGVLVGSALAVVGAAVGAIGILRSEYSADAA